jgi:hypothetical protein
VRARVTLKKKDMATEKTLEKKLREGIQKRKGWAIKFLPFVVNGLPDRLVLMPGGKLWFVEMKSPGKQPTPLQASVIRKLQTLGFNVRVIDSEILLNEFFKEVSNAV